MLRIKKIAFIICFATLVISCNRSKSDCTVTAQYQQLSAAAKEWFPYTGNTTLTFENSSSNTESLEFKNYFSGDDEIWNGDECPVTKGQFLRGEIIDTKSSDTISIQIGYNDQVQVKKRAGFILYYENKGVLILPSTYRRFQTSISLNNKTFSSVLAFECSPTDKCVSTGITKFYYAKGKGLVAFERNSVLWTLK